MTSKLTFFAWIFTLIGLTELIFLPVWESLLVLHIFLAGTTLFIILARPPVKSWDLFDLGTSILNAGRNSLTVLAIALPWMIIALFVIPIAEYNQLENLYSPNAPIFALAGLLIYPFIPIILSPRKEYHDLLYQELLQIILKPKALEEFLVARNDEKKMQEFIISHFPKISPLYLETEDSLITLDVFGFFQNLETRLKEDPGFSTIVESFQKA